jgi:hypothetical protein
MERSLGCGRQSLQQLRQKRLPNTVVHVMFFFRNWEVAMLYSQPHSVVGHFANVCCALMIGLFFAFIGLNLASGCGQPGGACIAVKDLVSPPPSAPQVAERFGQRAG